MKLDLPRWVVSLAFLICGALFATLACRIPEIQAAHHLTDGQLGATLLFSAGGALLGVGFAGSACVRWGSHRATLLTTVLSCAFLFGVGIAPTYFTLAVCLLGFGACTGMMDVAMNSNGVAVERAMGKSIMSSLHGMFSLGGLVFAGVGWLILKLGLGLALHFALICGTCALAMVILAPGMLVSMVAPSDVKSAFALPDRRIWAIGAIGFCAFLCEGAMGDWSAVYLHKVQHLSASEATYGYLGFTFAMTAMRFAGDRLMEWMGPSKTLQVFGAVTTVGMTAALWLGRLDSGARFHVRRGGNGHDCSHSLFLGWKSWRR